MFKGQRFDEVIKWSCKKGRKSESALHFLIQIPLAMHTTHIFFYLPQIWTLFNQSYHNSSTMYTVGVKERVHDVLHIPSKTINTYIVDLSNLTSSKIDS